MFSECKRKRWFTPGRRDCTALARAPGLDYVHGRKTTEPIELIQLVYFKIHTSFPCNRLVRARLP